jgi:hypothetical protein
MKRSIALAAALLLAAGTPALAANPLETVDVLCGGIAAEETERLVAEVRGATISLEFFSGTTGNYVKDVDVLFMPVRAPIEAFGIVTDGPRCLLELPPGEYLLHTWFNGHSRKTSATIPASRDAPVRLSLGFPEESGTDALLVPISAHKEATP